MSPNDFETLAEIEKAVMKPIEKVFKSVDFEKVVVFIRKTPVGDLSTLLTSISHSKLESALNLLSKEELSNIDFGRFSTILHKCSLHKFHVFMYSKHDFDTIKKINSVDEGTLVSLVNEG